jgi:hypothetical protein
MGKELNKQRGSPRNCRKGEKSLLSVRGEFVVPGGQESLLTVMIFGGKNLIPCEQDQLGKKNMSGHTSTMQRRAPRLKHQVVVNSQLEIHFPLPPMEEFHSRSIICGHICSSMFTRG